MTVLPFKRPDKPSSEPELVKVMLPGESLWVIVRGRNYADGTLVGEINNYPCGTGIGHPYRCGDLVRFAYIEIAEDAWAWVPLLERDDRAIDAECDRMVDRKFKLYGPRLAKLLLDQWLKR